MTFQAIERIFVKLLAPFKRRVLLMIGRAVLAAIDDSTKAQKLQVKLLADEVREDIERFQEYGFTSVPAKDIEGVVVFVGGNRAHGICVATVDRETRPTGLAEGEVALYTKDNAIRIYLKADGEVHLGTDPSDFVALAPATKDEISALRDTVNNFVTTFNSHIHTTTATIGPSAAPGVITPPTGPATAPAAVGEIAAEEVKAK